MIDTLAGIFGIVSGIVLALAAALAYFIQRARYLREIRPDLRLTIAENATLKRDPHGDYFFTVTFRVSNRSEATADRVQIEAIPVEFGTALRHGGRRLLPGEHTSLSFWSSMRATEPYVDLAFTVAYTSLRDAMNFIVSPLTLGRPRFKRMVSALFVVAGQVPTDKQTGELRLEKESYTLNTEVFVQH